MISTKKKIAILGLGNISYELCSSLISIGFIVSGTTNNFDRKHQLQELGVKVFAHNQILKCISNSTKIIITAPPDVSGCPIIREYFREIINSEVKWIGYLSSTSVYGNYYGQIVNENSDLKLVNPIAKSRYRGEQDILNFGKQYSVPIEIFRVSGIYGKNRNTIKQILSKNINPIFKENHFLIEFMKKILLECYLKLLIQK